MQESEVRVIAADVGGALEIGCIGMRR